MSHTNEMDNGVAVIANGGDLSGGVIFVLPDGRRMETTWDRMFALEAENAAKDEALEDAVKRMDDIAHLLGGEPSSQSIKTAYETAYSGEQRDALSPPTGNVLVPLPLVSAVERAIGYMRTIRKDRPIYEDGELMGHWQTEEWLDGLVEESDKLAALLKRG